MEVKGTPIEVKETIATPAAGRGVVIRTEVFTHQRLFSLDALRGFDMFWIIAGEHIFHGLAKASGNPFWQGISHQLDHAEWNGFRAYDLIFPLFLFLAGVSTPFSVGREMDNGAAKSKLLMRVIRRGLILVALGIYCNNGLKVQPLAEMRFCSVLGRIGLAYMFANIIYLYTKERAQMIWMGGLLVGYWLLLRFTSAPGFVIGDLTMEGNFASYIDRLIIPGKLYLGVHDPEGLVSTVPAIATALLGIWTGNILKNRETSAESKTIRMAVSGLICIAVALVWNVIFPINKNLWTSSFVMLTGGLSLLLVSLFYYIIDVKGIKKWAFFFSVIGMNSILIYISSRFINWEHANNAFFKWVGQVVGDPYNVVAMAVCLTIVKWAFVYFLYKKKIFLRV
jgi:predicted acyltransferase